MRPYAIENRLKLRNPIYLETSSYGHMGRENKKVIKQFFSKDGLERRVEVELFTWEKLDYIDIIKRTFKQ